ncbi:MAG: lipopolysaccharide biosynthesis protein, partial [Bacteroidetes bacterium]
MENKQNEVSIQELVKVLTGYWHYLLSKWRVLCLAGFIGGLFGVVYAKFIAIPTYSASLTFVLSNDSKSSGLGALAGNFGIDLGGSSEGAFAGENIIQLLQSRKMVERALVKVIPEAKTTLLQEIVQEKFEKKWLKKEHLKNQLPLPNDISKFTPQQDSLFTVIHTFILSKYLAVSRVDKKLSFYRVSTTSPREIIARYLPKYLVDEAAQFYIETKTKQARRNLNMLEHEADSLRGALGGNVNFVANQTDQLYNLNPSLQRERVPQQTSQIQVQVLGTAYGEVVKNLEIAKITLQKETPLYQLIDVPSKKLKKDKLSGLITAAIFGIICLIASVIGLLVKKIN